ncbi:MAG TPA: wax ester/triacylglycerol synthase family O-acyltransferase, partial [Solirubrobacterales bacterium]
MGDRLTPLDATFLELEEADESSHMHIGWAMIFDGLPEGGVPAVERIRSLLDERLGLLPRFRCRLSSPRTGMLSRPSWEPDPGFDLANHVRRARLPGPGGEAELLEWLGDFYSHRLDRARPLWEMTLLDGLAKGRWALAAKVHHSLIDGVSGSWVTNVILDAEREPAPGSKGILATLAAGGGEEASHANGANGDGDRGRLARIVSTARAGAGVVRHPDRLASFLSRSRGMAEVIVRDELIGAPRTSINVRIGGKRRLAAVRAPLEDLKLVKRNLGGTVNDVVLAVTAGGLRRLFEERGEGEDEGFRAMVPVSMRGAGESLALGNRVSSLFVELPVAEPDPLLRYRKTVAAAEGLKRGDHAESAEALVELAGAAPPLIHGAVARLAFTPRAFNVTVTN